MSDDFEPPDLSDMSRFTFDFSAFHPLDHNVWQCRHYPGGRRRHLQYRWVFQWRDLAREHTLCRIGLHHPGRVYGYRDGRPSRSWMACRHCWKRQSLTWREDR